ncbi:MAG: hypothetical protein FWD57_08680 [Polyangiaceae bacterium]|nr:hypothetical protein [Polyangiaceae bacterium]
MKERPEELSEQLTAKDVAALIMRVFAPREDERSMAFLVDLPDSVVADSPAWEARRDMVGDWAEGLYDLWARREFPLRVALVLYRNARNNNGELPKVTWSINPRHGRHGMPDNADRIENSMYYALCGGADWFKFRDIFEDHAILVAATEFSATAPLKIAARKYKFRAATMPGFSPAMIPALKLDYELINRRVQRLKELVDDATLATCRFLVDGKVERELRLDLRHRTGHASGGMLTEPGEAGNLPSGETFIVPYEGEIPGDPSRTEGFLPVELDGELVTYRVAGNRAVEVLDPDGSEVAKREALRIVQEPAYANLSELGLGVLGDFGIEPIGEILLDEKLGLHIAFGRSDHFGGTVGPKDFSNPDAVVHIDRVYVPKIQPRVAVLDVSLTTSSGEQLLLMRDGGYVIDF